MSRFAAVPTAALDDERLEALHIRVLTALCSYGDKDGWCRVGQDQIAARARTNPARVSSCIADLAEWGWVRKQRIGKMRVNVYQVLMDRDVDVSIPLPIEQEPVAEGANRSFQPSKSHLPPEQVTLAEAANPIGTPSFNTTSSSADARRAAVDRILAVCGVGMADPSKTATPLMDLTARIDRWLGAYDLEREILPVVEMKTKHQRATPMHDFRWIEQDLAKFHAKTLSKLPVVEISNERAGQSQSRGSANGKNGHGARSGQQHADDALVAAVGRRRGGGETQDDFLVGFDGGIDRVA